MEAKINYKKHLKEKFEKEKTVTVEKYEEMVQKNKLLNEELSDVKRKNKKWKLSIFLPSYTFIKLKKSIIYWDLILDGMYLIWKMKITFDTCMYMPMIQPNISLLIANDNTWKNYFFNNEQQKDLFCKIENKNILFSKNSRPNLRE